MRVPLFQASLEQSLHHPAQRFPEILLAQPEKRQDEEDDDDCADDVDDAVHEPSFRVG